jgi:hypothetical protein
MACQIRTTVSVSGALAIALFIAAVAGSARGQGAGGVGAGGSAGSSGGTAAGGSASAAGGASAARPQLSGSLDQADPSGLLPNNDQQSSTQAGERNSRLLPAQNGGPRGTAGQQRGLGQANAQRFLESDARTNYYNAPSHYATGIGGPADPQNADDRPMMGIDLDARYPNAAVVGRIHPGSGADNAGLMPGDTIRAINNVPVASPGDLINSVARLRVGDTVRISFTRPHAVEVTLGTRQAIGRGETVNTAQQDRSNGSNGNRTAAPASSLDATKTQDSNLGSGKEELNQLDRKLNSIPADKSGDDAK